MTRLTACHLGPTSYRDGLAIQEGLVRARAAGETGDWLLYPDHPPVLTVGRSPSPDGLRVDPEELRTRGIELFEVARGGDITWHGPGQLVGYLIADLTPRGRDLHRLLRDLEQTLIDSLGRLGIAGERVAGRTGVWVAGRKIASLGVAVRRWVSYHGFALNVAPDLRAFELIHPCGLHGIQMTSVANCLGERAPTLATMRHQVAATLCRQMGYTGWSWSEASEARQCATPGLEPSPSGAAREREV
ncbi:MAG TPA: lipoyl(octanoyl) transferase LipB [Candidatus Limnocylindria bacterium]|nr:lipoyl(octanoyl) transferase LipB [Candidatus Limnocylindria bacterium]